MTCRRCGRSIHPMNRDQWCPTCHQGRGLCGPCYTHAYRSDQLDAYPPLRNIERPQHDAVAGKRGTVTAYIHGCRCSDCTTAKTRQQKTWRLAALHHPLQIDSTGTVRRLRALAAMGWPAHAIGGDMGVTEDQVVLWRKGRHRKILASSAARVIDVYDRLSMTPGPSSWTRSYARNRGWAPPLAWDDETIDDPTIAPHVGGHEDRSSAARRQRRVDEYYELRDMGYPDHAIARRWQLRSDVMDRWLRRNITNTEEAAA